MFNKKQCKFKNCKYPKIIVIRNKIRFWKKAFESIKVFVHNNKISFRDDQILFSDYQTIIYRLPNFILHLKSALKYIISLKMQFSLLNNQGCIAEWMLFIYFLVRIHNFSFIILKSIEQLVSLHIKHCQDWLEGCKLCLEGNMSFSIRKCCLIKYSQKKNWCKIKFGSHKK